MKKIEQEIVDYSYQGFCAIGISLSRLREGIESKSFFELRSAIEMLADAQETVLGNFEALATEKCTNRVANGEYPELAGADLDALLEGLEE